jgi:SAM-dependent methyltransferase
MASSYTATDPQAYEQLMGRWSGLLAEQLIAFTGIESGDRLLDVGCGTGSLALALAAHPEPARIVGIDIAAPYIAFATKRSRDRRLSFLVGDAVALDLPATSFDRYLASGAQLHVRFRPGARRYAPSNACGRGHCRRSLGFCRWPALPAGLLGYRRRA